MSTTAKRWATARRWDSAEEFLLEQLAATTSHRPGRVNEITAALQAAGYVRTHAAVRSWLSNHQLSAPRGRPWTAADDAQLTVVAAAVRTRGGTLADVVDVLHAAGNERTPFALRKRMNDLRLFLSTRDLPPPALQDAPTPSQRQRQRQTHQALIAEVLRRVFPGAAACRGGNA